MLFVRISIMRPRPEVRAEVLAHFQELITASSRLPGFVRGYVLNSSDSSGEVGRVSVWESQEVANRAANDAHIMAVHSELMLDDRGTMQDWNLDAPFFLEHSGGHDL